MYIRDANAGNSVFLYNTQKRCRASKPNACYFRLVIVMKAVTIILSLLFCCTALSSAQNVKLDWAASMRGSSYDVCQAIALDDDGNLYAAGYFSTTVDFDPGAGVYNLNSANADAPIAEGAGVLNP